MEKADLVVDGEPLTINSENLISFTNLPLTEDEAEVLDNYLFRKICRLEDAGLTDSHCYPLLCSMRRKLIHAQKAFTNK